MHGKSNYQLWMELCDLVCDHPQEIKGLKVEPIIRSGIRRFTDQVGKLWNSLANYWILLGHFEKARDVFEEGIKNVMTVRDFTQIFDTYAQFEETIMETKMQEAATRAENNDDDPEEDLELDLRLLRFEQLMDRRPFLVNDVLLRQNPNNVHEWEKRVSLWKDNKEQAKELQEIVKLLTEKPIIDYSKVKDIYEVKINLFYILTFPPEFEVAKKLRIGLQFAYFKVKWGLQKCDISTCERMVKQKLEDYKNYPNKQRTHLPFNVSPVPPSKNRFTDEKAKAVFEILDSLDLIECPRTPPNQIRSINDMKTPDTAFSL
ncbi:9030_t:CDS:2, partial [Entrophospora sp. SA101]